MNVTTELVIETCGHCNRKYAVAEEARNSKVGWSCPYCRNRWVAKETKEERLQKLLDAANGQIVAQVLPESDARLIAAAPEMLAALEEAGEVRAIVCSTAGPTELKIWAAIRKAKGG